MTIDPGINNLIFGLIVDATTGEIVCRLKLTNGEYHERSGHKSRMRRVKKKLQKFVVYDTALSLVPSKTSSFDKACAHIKAFLTLEVEIELPNGTTSTVNAFSSKLSTIFQMWIANAKFRVYRKQLHIIDSFVAGFRAPTGDMVDLIVYGDGSFGQSLGIKGIKSGGPVIKVKKSVNRMHENVIAGDEFRTSQTGPECDKRLQQVVRVSGRRYNRMKKSGERWGKGYYRLIQRGLLFCSCPLCKSRPYYDRDEVGAINILCKHLFDPPSMQRGLFKLPKRGKHNLRPDVPRNRPGIREWNGISKKDENIRNQREEKKNKSAEHRERAERVLTALQIQHGHYSVSSNSVDMDVDEDNANNVLEVANTEYQSFCAQLPQPTTTGIINPDNKCFVNAFVSATFHTSMLRQAIFGINQQQQSPLCQELISVMQHLATNTQPVDASDLYSTIIATPGGMPYPRAAR